jgi:hypothetical protein
MVPTRPQIASIAAALAARHAPTAQAVLAYGSCLRDGGVSEGLVDLYVLVDDYAGTHASAWERRGNALLPPNVYYAEHEFDGAMLRAKYAIVSLDQFAEKVSPNCANPYFWARFAQPCALLCAGDAETRDAIVAALAIAVRTFLSETLPLSAQGASPVQRWIAGLEATYATELRSETGSRAAKIVDADRDYFAALAQAYDREAAAPPGVSHSWRGRRITGKVLAAARLVKAGFTFQGGADYLAWKIARHSGVEVAVKPWHRRHPILAAIAMAPRLWLRGGFR